MQQHQGHARREWLRRSAGIVALAVSLAMTGDAAATSGAPSGATAYQELYRPQFHYTPAKDWMNDPNGLVYYEGEYHLFYQHKPERVAVGRHVMGACGQPRPRALA